MTKEERKEYNKKYCKEYYKKNKEKIKEKNKLYKQQHKEHYKELDKKYRETHREQYREYNKNYCLRNVEKRKETSKKYRDTHKEHLAELQRNYKAKHDKERKERDPIFKLRCNIRSLISKTIRDKGYTKSKKTEEILGCAIKDFIEYIQTKFKKGMTLENYGEWHIDHIIPISSAKTEEEIIRLNHYTNLQPLWADENIRKSNKIL